MKANAIPEDIRVHLNQFYSVDANSGQLWVRQGQRKVQVWPDLDRKTAHAPRMLFHGKDGPCQIAVARVFWFLVAGEEPVGRITFRDKDPFNMKASNLKSGNIPSLRQYVTTTTYNECN